MKSAYRMVAGAGAAFGSFLVLAATAMASTLTGGSSSGGSGSSGGSVSLINPLNTTSFPTVVNNVIAFLSTDVAIPLTVIMVLIGAFQMMTSSGEPEKFGKARKTLTYAAIGLAVALIATGITSIIQSVLNGS